MHLLLITIITLRSNDVAYVDSIDVDVGHMAGSVRALDSLGKLWKLIMQFFRTCKVVRKEKFFKNGYGEF